MQSKNSDRRMMSHDPFRRSCCLKSAEHCNDLMVKKRVLLLGSRVRERLMINNQLTVLGYCILYLLSTEGLFLFWVQMTRRQRNNGWTI